MKELVEEAASRQKILEQLMKVKEEDNALMMMDLEPAQRVLDPPTTVA